jgi:hypothetical protein
VAVYKDFIEYGYRKIWAWLIRILQLAHSLREMSINISDSTHLTLSKSKQSELAVYIKPFTDRLTMQICGSGGDGGGGGGTTNINALFRDADPNVARQKLMTISQTLNIDLQSVPQFLEDYGDIYLSIAYYRQILVEISPVIMDFLEACFEISKHDQLKQNSGVMKVVKRLEAKTANSVMFCQIALPFSNKIPRPCGKI